MVAFDEKVEQRRKYECTETRTANGNARCQWTIFIEIGCHADDGRQIDETQTETGADANCEN